MKEEPKNAGRPRKPPLDKKAEYLDVRVDSAEKDTFQAAADLAGLGLSAWVRMTLRRTAIRELEDLGRPIPILETLDPRAMQGADPTLSNSAHGLSANPQEDARRKVIGGKADFLLQFLQEGELGNMLRSVGEEVSRNIGDPKLRAAPGDTLTALLAAVGEMTDFTPRRVYNAFERVWNDEKDPLFRQVAWLCYFGGKSEREAAKLLSKNAPNGIRESRVSRVVSNFREKLIEAAQQTITGEGT